MSDFLFRPACLFIGYAFGLIQSAYLAGKLVAKIDIREHGSGNPGMTNVTRVMGTRAGLAVFVIDFLKAVAAYILCSLLFDGSGLFTGGASYLPGLYAGLGVILGHVFPFYMKFKGGKGAASVLGVIFCFDWRVMLICYISGIIGVAAFRFISLGALIVFALFPIGMIITQKPPEVVVLGVLIAAIGYIRHRKNIGKLIRGNENKFTFGKQEGVK